MGLVSQKKKMRLQRHFFEKLSNLSILSNLSKWARMKKNEKMKKFKTSNEEK